MIGIMTQRNSIETGYPFIEAILSYLPACDIYIVNDGGSTDGSLEYLERLADVYPKIMIEHIPDYPSQRWDCITEQFNMMLLEYVEDNEWIFLGSADELLHERDIQSFIDIHKNASKETLAFRFPRIEIPANWEPNMTEEKHYLPARTALNVDGLYMDWAPYGGDEFLDQVRRWRRNPPLCCVSDIIAWHIYCTFPENNYAKREKDAKFIAQADDARQRIFVETSVQINHYSPKEITTDIPTLIRFHAFKDRYEINERLFDPEWIKTLTGVKY